MARGSEIRIKTEMRKEAEKCPERSGRTDAGNCPRDGMGQHGSGNRPKAKKYPNALKRRNSKGQGLYVGEETTDGQSLSDMEITNTRRPRATLGATG